MENTGGIEVVNANLAYQSDVFDNLEVIIAENPLKWSEVSLSDVISHGKRLEASVFDVETKQAYRNIEKCKYASVNLIGKNCPVKIAHYGGRLKRNYVEKENSRAIGFIGSSEMLDINPRPVKYMVNDERVQDLHVKRGTVLISRSGTIGNMAFVNKTLEKFLISEHAMRLECDDNPGYVYAYLKSKTGQTLIRSNIYGSVIQQIEPEHLETIPIPNAPMKLKTKINDLIIRSYDLRDESNYLTDKATEMLIDELHLSDIDNIEFKKDTKLKSFSVKLSHMDGRADASYHRPIIDVIRNQLFKYAKEVTSIADERVSKAVILPGRFKRVYVDEGFGRIFIGGKQLWELDPSNKKYLSLAQHSDRIEEQLELHENMTLITCSGTVGKVALVGKQWENWTANQHIIRVVPASEEIAGYLNIFLASDYGNALITRYIYGAVIDEIDDMHVRQIPIPLLKNYKVQEKINMLALEANRKRYEAYCFEQEALQIIDKEVVFAK